MEVTSGHDLKCFFVSVSEFRSFFYYSIWIASWYDKPSHPKSLLPIFLSDLKKQDYHRLSPLCLPECVCGLTRQAPVV